MCMSHGSKGPLSASNRLKSDNHHYNRHLEEIWSVHKMAVGKQTTYLAERPGLGRTAGFCGQPPLPLSGGYSKSVALSSHGAPTY